jgi:hypothetical protein
LLGSDEVRDATWAPGDTRTPLRADMRSWSAWGSSTIAGLHPEIEGLATTAVAAFYGGGTPSEKSQHTLARLGSHSALLSIPGGTLAAFGSVEVRPPSFPDGTALRTYSGTPAGVPCTLEV